MDSEAGIMCWMVAINGDDPMMDDIIAVFSDGSWGHNLTGLHAGKASCRFSSDFSTFFTRPWAHHPLPPWKQAWRRPTCPSPVTMYVCTTWRIPSRFFMCLQKMYHLNGHSAGDQTLLIWSDWPRTTTSTNERQMRRTLKNMKPGFHNSSNQCGAALSWRWNILRE